MNRDPCTFHRCKRDGERNRRPGYTLAWALKRGVRVFTKRRGLCFFFKSACGQIVVPRVYELSHCAVLDGRKTTGMPRLKIFTGNMSLFLYVHKKTGKINGKGLTLRCYTKIRIRERTVKLYQKHSQKSGMRDIYRHISLGPMWSSNTNLSWWWSSS